MYQSFMRFPGDPFASLGQLQRQFEQLFGTLGLPSSIRAVGRGSFPAINMGSTDENVEIYALAPGIDPSKLEVSVDKGVLTISGERESAIPEPGDKLSVYAQERFVGSFKRVMSLPQEVDAVRVDATYRNGVLRIVIPKREASKPRRIEVKNLS